MLGKLKRSSLVLCAILVSVSCGGKKKVMNKYYGAWELISAYGEDYSAVKATIEFRGRGTLFGFGGCNNYSGTYALDEEKRTLTFGPLMATKKYCQGKNSEAEGKLFRALNNTTLYLPKPEGIYLQNARKETLAFIKKR